MAQEAKHQACLKWEGGHIRWPCWPSEPNINVITFLAKRHLRSELPTPPDDSLLNVRFFARGVFNKVYQISYVGYHTTYLLRVAIPILPYYKTANEVATYAYVRANTRIPLPRLLAWDTCNENELGYEWILMEKLESTPLEKVWRMVPWERKLEIVEELAGMMKQLRGCTFDRIGGLYFENSISADEDISAPLPTDKPDYAAALVQITDDNGGWVQSLFRNFRSIITGTKSALHSSQNCEYMSAEISTFKVDLERRGFAVGRAFENVFFEENRPLLPGRRGPYKSSLDWAIAATQFQLHWLEHGRPVKGDDDYDEDFEEEVPSMRWVAHELLDVLPQVLADEEPAGSFVLHHHDLNAGNILVDPETFKIIGIIDWEMINVVPKWKASEHPWFLDFIPPFDYEEEEPPTPTIVEDRNARRDKDIDHDEVGEDNNDGENDMAWNAKDRWQYMRLRKHFDETMVKLSSNDDGFDHAGDEQTKEMKAKFACLRNIEQITDLWNWVDIWLKEYKNGGVREDPPGFPDSVK